uniref:Lipoprotein n=1 Tax=Streptomyces sp. NBC_01401 TaxID=2903854 RepID=A0AAU3GMK6_9ACTN
MRAIRVAPVALLGAAACVLMAPAASADVLGGGPSTSFTPSITPSSVAPGGQVTLGATGCTTDATAFSGVFDTTTIPSGRSATATVDWDAKRGASYEVTFRCGTATKSANLTITSGATSSPTTSPTTAPTTSSTASPSGVLGGLGGSVDTMDPAEIAAGSALVAVASAGAFYVLRRRRTHRQH